MALGALWFVVALIVIIVVTGVVVLFSYLGRLSRREHRERTFRTAMTRLDFQKAAALEAGDRAGLRALQLEEQSLRGRYLAGEEL